MPQPNLDPVSVAVLMVGWLVGERYAAVAGPYAVILFAWFGGVLVGLYLRPPASRGKLALFVAATLVLTVGITVPAAEIIARYASVSSAALLFPVAFAVPAVGDDWIPLIKWVWGSWKRRRMPQERQP